MAKVRPDWIAADWGTSRLRVWAMSDAGHVLGANASDAGMGTLRREVYEAALLALIGDWLVPDRTTRVVACGMLGARQGWVEAPYLAVPSAPHAPGRHIQAPTDDARLEVLILPGIQQAAPPDVMRGEETQLAGFLMQRPAFDGTVCLPGTHTKWARVRDGRIESFRTFMTGELFTLLAERSVLRHSVGPGWDDAAFAAAIERAVTSPAALTSELFALRAGALLAGLAPAAARAGLSGLLIGAELAGLGIGQRAQDLAIIGESQLAGRYAAAIRQLGREVEVIDADRATIAGLVAAHEILRGRAGTCGT